MLNLSLAIAALIVAMAVPAHAQYTGGYSQATNDLARQKLMKAQTDALQAYIGCLQTASEAKPCQPPQPVQIASPQNRAPPKYLGGYGQATNDLAQNNLIKAQARALDAYGQCLKAKPPGACGPSP